MIRRWVLFAVVCVFIYFVRHDAYAVSLDTSLSFDRLDEQAEVEIPLSLDCSGCSSDSFLRGVFFIPGTTSYFGYTKSNDGSWINAPGGSCTQYFKVTLDDLLEGSWSGALRVKVDRESTYYHGPGEYTFKIARYTASCNSPTWSHETTISLIGPTHTSTPTQTPSPSPTHTPTHTMSPTPSQINTPTSTISVSMTPFVITHKPAALGTTSASISIVNYQEDNEATSGANGQLSVKNMNEEFSLIPSRTDTSMTVSVFLILMGCSLLFGVYAAIQFLSISSKNKNTV